MTKDKIQIWASPLGMIMTPRLDFIFASAKEDGTWNWDKINDFLFNIADRGANGFRDFPPWIDTRLNVEKMAPWKYDGSKQKYDLSKFKQLYFDNLRKLAKLAKMYNLDFCIDVLNSSETRIKGVKTWGPWKRNVQNLEDYFYKSDAFVFIGKLIKKLIKTFEGLDNIYYQTCNEPSIKEYEYLAYTYTALIKNGVKLDRIFTGMDPLRKNIDNKYATFYRKFRSSVCDIMNDVNYEVYIKEDSWSGLHQASKENMKLYFETGLKPGEEIPSIAGRCVSYSMDGLREPFRPTYFEVFESILYLLKTKSGAYRKKKLGIEILTGKRASELNSAGRKKGYDGKKLKVEYAGLEGAVEAVKKHIGKYPENYKKFGKAFDLPEWIIGKKEPVEPVEPVQPGTGNDDETEPIKIIKEKKMNFFNFKKYWRVGMVIIFVGIPLILTFTWTHLWAIPAVGFSHALWHLKIIKK